MFCGLCGKRCSLLPALRGQPVTLRLIVVLHRGGGVQDGGAQIGHDVLDRLGGVGHHIEDVLNVLAGQLVQPQPDGFGGLRLLVNALPNDMIAHGNAIANTGRQIAAAIATSLLVTAETSVTASHMSQGVKSATASGIAFSYLLCAAISLVALIICIFTVTTLHGKAVMSL